MRRNPESQAEGLREQSCRFLYRRFPRRSLGRLPYYQKLGLLGRGFRLLVVLGRSRFVAERNGRLGLELFVVLVLDGLANARVLILEMERVVGDGVGGEPIFAIDLFAIRLKLGELLVLALLHLSDTATVALDDLQIPIVHPYNSLEIALTLLERFGLHREGVTRDLIQSLLAQVAD